MAQYGITRVRLDASGAHVDAVEYRAIIRGGERGWKVGPPIQVLKPAMLDIVRTPGNFVITMPLAANGNYYKGQPVAVERGPNGTYYLESVADGIERNNLRALPAF